MTLADKQIKTILSKLVEEKPPLPDFYKTKWKKLRKSYNFVLKELEQEVVEKDNNFARFKRTTVNDQFKKLKNHTLSSKYKAKGIAHELLGLLFWYSFFPDELSKRINSKNITYKELHALWIDALQKEVSSLRRTYIIPYLDRKVKPILIPHKEMEEKRKYHFEPSDDGTSYLKEDSPSIPFTIKFKEHEGNFSKNKISIYKAEEKYLEKYEELQENKRQKKDLYNGTCYTLHEIVEHKIDKHNYDGVTIKYKQTKYFDTQAFIRLLKHSEETDIKRMYPYEKIFTSLHNKARENPLEVLHIYSYIHFNIAVLNKEGTKIFTYRRGAKTATETANLQWFPCMNETFTEDKRGMDDPISYGVHRNSLKKELGLEIGDYENVHLTWIGLIPIRLGAMFHFVTRLTIDEKAFKQKFDIAEDRKEYTGEIEWLEFDIKKIEQVCKKTRLEFKPVNDIFFEADISKNKTGNKQWNAQSLITFDYLLEKYSE